MSRREVVRYPDPRLKARAPAFDPARHGELDALVADLVDTMRSFPRCVGIAAPQIGVPARVCVVDCTDHPKVPHASGLLVLVDPALTLGGETAIGREGCLSIPELTGNVRRSVEVEWEEEAFTGFEARALQHEVDHLDGVLFLDRVVSAADVFARKGGG